MDFKIIRKVGFYTWLRFTLGVPTYSQQCRLYQMSIDNIDERLRQLKIAYSFDDLNDETSSSSDSGFDWDEKWKGAEPKTMGDKETRILKVVRISSDYAVLEEGIRIELDEPGSVNVGDYLKVQLKRKLPNQQWRPVYMETAGPDFASNIVTSRTLDQNDKMEKTIAASVISIEDNIIKVDKENLTFSLDKVSCNFIIKKGDSVKLNIVCTPDIFSPELPGDMLNVESVEPLREMIFDGYITCWQEENAHGLIKAESFALPVLFDLSVCDFEYKPILGDHVFTKCIESKQGTMEWRAISVTLFQSDKPQKRVKDAEELELLEDKMGLVLSRNTNIGTLRCGESGTLQVTLVNRSNKAVRLLKVTPHPRLCPKPQFKLLQCPRCPYLFPPTAEVTLVFSCTAQYLGSYEDLFILEFEGGIYLARNLVVTVIGKYDKLPDAPVSSKQWKNHKRSQDESPIIRGQRNGKLHPFRRRLQQYPVSERAFGLVKKSATERRGRAFIQQSLYDNFPWLTEELCSSNYITRLHQLLELEEAEVSHFVQRWSKNSVELKRSEGSKYLLELPGLTEGRPSLMVGDSVICKHINGGPNYEGVVSKVMLLEVMLNFAEMFPCPVEGDRFYIKFNISRIPFRRLHAAVDAAWRELGPKVLFPSTHFQMNSPQIKVFEENSQTMLREGMKLKCNVNKETLLRTPPHSKNEQSFSLLHDIVDFSRDDTQYSSSMMLTTPKETASSSSGISGASNWMVSQVSRVPVCERLFKVLSPKPPEAPKFGRWEWSANNIQPMEASVANSDYSSNKSFSDQPYDDEVSIISEHPVKRETLLQKSPRQVIQWFNHKLNKHQRAAVCNVLTGEARPLPYIIFGPPGTGKTMTIVETILQIYTLLPESKLVVGTPSNSAADLLALRLLDSGCILPGTLVRLVSFSYKDHLPPSLIQYRKVTGNYDVEPTRNCDKIGLDRITIGTCASLGSLVHSTSAIGKVTHVLLDEAGQATEAEAMLVAALLGKPQQIILAGDPMQLGPVLQGRYSVQGGLGISLLSRLLRCGPYNRDLVGFPQTQGYNPLLVTMLVNNYRSVPEILSLPARLFYHNELVCTVSQDYSKEADLLNSISGELPKRIGKGPPPLVFHGVRGCCEREADSPSWFNSAEVKQVLHYVNALYNVGVQSSDIGVITPYNKQVQKIRTAFYLHGSSIPKVGSVEEFQGQERLCVIFSGVRSSEDCAEEGLGFLANPNRMNTAITRARALLIVIGDPCLLYKDPAWRELILDCIKRNAYLGCDLPAQLQLE